MGDRVNVGTRARLEHQPALDGLRGLAVAGVLLFHGGRLSGGYLGVDAFFVLSGFLITSLLLVEARDRGTISFRSFWARRARRLIPALACVLVFVAFYAAFVAAPEELETIRGDAIATLAYVANWRQVFSSSDYFALFRSPSPLQHTWSLAIEEQFYLLWPLVVFGLVVRRSSGEAVRRILFASVALAVASAAWALFLYERAGATRVYYGTDTRIAAIAIGAALAAALAMRGPITSRSGRRGLEVAAGLALVLLGFAWFRLSGSSAILYRGGLLACGLATALVIAAAVHPDRGPVQRVLSWRVLCWLGLISYGLYLWHWPLFVFLDSSRVHLTGWPLFVVQITATLLVSVACYRWVEQPIRRGAVTVSVAKVAVPAVAVLLVGVILWSTAESPNSFATAPAPKRGGVMLVGNSIANSLAHGLIQEKVGFANRTILGCSLLRGEIAFGQQAVRCGRFRLWVGQQRPEYVILMTGTYETMDVIPPKSATRLKPGSEAFAEYYRTALQRAIEALTSTGAVVVVTTVPCVDIPYFPDYLKEQTVMNPERLRIENKLLVEVATRKVNQGRVVVADLNKFLCPEGKYQAGLGSVENVRNDGEHFSLEGAGLVTKWLLGRVPDLRRAGANTNLDVGDRITSKLFAAGWSCSRTQPIPSSRPEMDPLAVYQCLVGKDRPNIRIAKSPAALPAMLTVAREQGCGLARQRGEPSATIAHGDVWAISASTILNVSAATALRNAGEKVTLKTVTC